MKKFTFALTVVAFMLFAVSPLLAKGMTIGVKGGLNLATFNGRDEEGTTTRVGALGGGFMCYNVTETFLGIQPELLFSMKGADVTDTDASLHFNYLEIPVLLKLRLFTEGKIKPSFLIGPALGVLLSATSQSGDSSADTKQYLKTLDFGIVVGASVGYEMAKNVAFIEARYEAGLGTVWDYTDEELRALGEAAGLQGPIEQPEMKNGVFSLMLGYGIGF